MNLPQSIIDAMDKLLSGYEFRKGKAVQIYWRGKIIKAQSGKAVWPSIGAAKNAFRLFDWNTSIKKPFKEAFPDRVKVYSSYTDIPTDLWNEVIDELQRLGLLEFRVFGQNG